MFDNYFVIPDTHNNCWIFVSSKMCIVWLRKWHWIRYFGFLHYITWSANKKTCPLVVYYSVFVHASQSLNQINMLLIINYKKRQCCAKDHHLLLLPKYVLVYKNINKHMYINTIEITANVIGYKHEKLSKLGSIICLIVIIDMLSLLMLVSIFKKD